MIHSTLYLVGTYCDTSGWKLNEFIILWIISTIKGDNRILCIVKIKFKLLSLKLLDWWIKVTIIAITTPPITILMYSVAANVVSNPLYADAANAVYEEE